MRCFFCENIQKKGISPDDMPKREAEHLFRVIRGKPGDMVLLTDGSGHLAEAIIKEGRFLRIAEIKTIPPPRTKIHLFTAPPRRQRLDRMLEQSAEIGVWSVTFIETKRSVALPSKKSAFERMRLHLIEGCKQAHNPFLPELHGTVSLNKAVESVVKKRIPALFGAVVPDRSEKKMRFPFSETKELAWFTGPEGGFTEDEENLMQRAGIAPFSLGPWIMRIETAAIAGCSLFMNYSSFHHRDNLSDS